MGLLEKAQQRKQILDETKDSIETARVEDKVKSSGLLEKARQGKQEILEKTRVTKEKITVEEREEPEQKVVYSGLKVKKEGQQDVVDERTGFGWKGLGSRRVVFDHNTNDYLYEVSEPVLDEGELEIKNELTRLFKMLADVNVFGIDKEEKKKYLGETLEQIIIDNDIKFDVSKIEKADKKSFLSFTRMKSKNKEGKMKGENLQDDKKIE